MKQEREGYEKRNAGFQIGSDKIQVSEHLFLEFQLYNTQRLTQKTQLKISHLKTLNDFSKIVRKYQLAAAIFTLEYRQIKALI